LIVADDVTIDLQDNSPYRVALELALEIAKAETARGIAKQESTSDPRAYLLNLYAQSRRVVVDGFSVEEALEEEEEEGEDEEEEAEE
jgi:hypothetical protein